MTFDLACNSTGGDLDLKFGLTWTGIPALNSIPGGLNFTIVLNIVPSQSFCSLSQTGGDTLSGSLLTYTNSSFNFRETGFNLDQFLYFEANVSDSTFGIHNVTLLDLSYDVNNGTSISLISNQDDSPNLAIQYTILPPAAHNTFNFYIALNDSVFHNILSETGDTLTFTATFATWLVPQGSTKRSVDDGSSGAIQGGTVELNAAISIKSAPAGVSSNYYVDSGSARLYSFLDFSWC